MGPRLDTKEPEGFDCARPDVSQGIFLLWLCRRPGAPIADCPGHFPGTCTRNVCSGRYLSCDDMDSEDLSDHRSSTGRSSSDDADMPRV